MIQGKKNRPPRLADWLLSRLIDPAYREEFFGDLQEIHEERIVSKGAIHAWFAYWIDAFHLIIGFSSKEIFKLSNIHMMTGMMFKIALRNALRQKQFTLLNLTGLTLGIAASLLIGLYVYDEMTFDTFHKKGERIYRVNQPMIWSDWNEQFASTGPNVAVALREDVHEFEQVTRLLNNGEQTVRIHADSGSHVIFFEKKCFAAEENFFSVFSFPLLDGDPASALKDPMNIVITAATATRYFGEKDPIGKTVELKEKNGSWTPYTVRAVLADVPARSHLQFDILISLSSFDRLLNAEGWKWIWTSFSTYVLVKEGTDIEALMDKIQAVPPKWAAQTTQRIFNQTFSEFTGGKPWKLYLQPIKDIYLSESPAMHRFGPTGNPLTVKVFGMVGMLVLVLSCINFMNLSTARSANRAKDVGIRKALGSKRNAVAQQFIVESLLFVFTSTVAALAIVQIFLAGFNTLAGKNLTLLDHFMNPLFAGALAVFIFLLGVAAGSYPAFYLSSFKPLETLKGKMIGGFKKTYIRNGLVVFQFIVSIILIIVTLVVQKQLAFASSLDVGFSKKNILQLHNIEQLGTNAEVIQKRLETNPAIQQIAQSHSVPPYVWEGERYKALGAQSNIVDINNLRSDENYLNLLNVEFIAGRNFDVHRPADKYAIILNEEAVRALGWGNRKSYGADTPIGKFVVQAFDNEEKLEVIGVVKNFNFNSLRQKIDPLMIVHHQNDKFWNYGLGRSFLSVRLDGRSVTNHKDLAALLNGIRNEFQRIDPSVQFEFSFMDQEFENTFRTEQKMGTILSLLTILAVIIACLGLLGLAAFSAEQKKKELGIRKIHGAQIHQLVFLFSFEFTRLVALAIILASPVAWFLATKWLESFAHRTIIDPWIFISAGLGALFIATATISFLSFSAANRNPIETIRTE